MPTKVKNKKETNHEEHGGHREKQEVIITFWAQAKINHYIRKYTKSLKRAVVSIF
ncbi:MAG: hypothetical protein HRF42_02535 [Candidatus Brocadia sp.]|jgi:hypothetical protein